METKKQLCLKKRWKYKKSNGEVIIFWYVLEKVSVWVNKFKEVVDVAVQFDPIHASLPWAAIRFLLQVNSLLFITGHSNTESLVEYQRTSDFRFHA